MFNLSLLFNSGKWELRFRSKEWNHIGTAPAAGLLRIPGDLDHHNIAHCARLDALSCLLVAECAAPSDSGLHNFAGPWFVAFTPVTPRSTAWF